MKINREALAMVLGSAVCILAGLSASCEIPSAALSWISSNDTLMIRSRECAPGLVARIFLLGFAILSLVLLFVGGRRVVRLRYMAWFVLFAFMLVPTILPLVAPNTVKDSQILYDQVDLVIGDMEVNLNHQQVAWRAQQRFDRMLLTISTSRKDLDPALIPVQSLEWSSVHLIVDNVLGYSNALLNLLGRGWYLALAGLVCWIMGAYSGDPDARRRRARDIVVVPIGAAAMLLIVLLPRMVTQFHSTEARKYAANGQYLASALHSERANSLSPLRKISLFQIATDARKAEQLSCESCNEMMLRKANQALTSSKDFASAISYLERVAHDDPHVPGLRYWLSISHVLKGFERLESGQYSAADLDFSRALELVPIDAAAWYGRSMVQTRLQDFDSAAKFLENALAIQQTLGFKRLTLQGQLHLMRAWSKVRKGDLVAAHENYSRFLNPESW